MTGAALMASLALLAPGGGACFAAARPIAAGAALMRADLAPVVCKRAARPPLRYDARSGNPVASAEIPAGTYLGRLAPVADVQVPAGAELTLRSTVGVVTIERRVTAVQPGRTGGRLFVRDSSGKVFAVPLAANAE